MSSSNGNHSNPQEYIPVHYHYQMLQDPLRMLGFQEAIKHVVPSGGRVIDLGGGTGVLSHYAAQYAQKVWYVEMQDDLAHRAANLLTQNQHSGNIEIIHADARSFVPPEPVDVVICEMLHAALLQEKQIETIASFKRAYLERFGEPPPSFIPPATSLAVEPVFQDYDFFGYFAPVPILEAPGTIFSRSAPFSSPLVYQEVQYDQSLPQEIRCDLCFDINQPGIINALCFHTINILAYVHQDDRPLIWANQNLILPLSKTLSVRRNDQVRINFSYRPGSPIHELEDVIEASLV